MREVYDLTVKFVVFNWKPNELIQIELFCKVKFLYIDVILNMFTDNLESYYICLIILLLFY